ncbi:topoisomerase DNA-binding C4 zinc finger domain-containing protein [Ruficoccus sp. ZRK36]|nr:topoisomerase DNA-binding C4 zinc finger domain-containing protein [Ruficoccus sp. ZRK36]
MSAEEASLALGYLTGLRNDPTLTRRAHLQSLESRHASTTVCPKCGKALVVRTARSGKNAGNSFLGCSAYPKCKYTKSL